MATPNIVPRAVGEGGLGTAAKGWGEGFITNATATSTTQGGKLVLAANDSLAAMGDDHRLGVIEFKGEEDASDTLSIGARIQAVARGAWGASDNDADLEFYTTDGTTESKVLTLDADKAASFTGDVTVANNITITGATNGIIHTNSGTVTQGTSITNGVTLNTTSGVIQMYAAAIAGDANIEFTVTNSTVQADSVILLTMQDENTVNNTQLVCATHTIASGSFKITVANTDEDASSATASKIHFLIINNS